ncbi:hypothetical protein [Chlamydia gallinacea]|uniref:hypothetical protein n=1 Tax=Chlamydia gallinacea TaxID=1457153 RepID=UPI001C83E316|nr:hypothetical protein [Chlamydia gallinacea]MBX6687783.1 hypothetical protein [Chlamydia gallinacea]
MKLAQICFVCVPKFTFMSTTQRNIYHYIPAARHLAKKILASIFALLGVSALACSVLAAGMCQTFLPCIGLLILGMLLFIFAYCHYVKAEMRLEIPQQQFEKYAVSAITEEEYHSLLFHTWHVTSLGSYHCKWNKHVHICEGTKERLRDILASRVGKENGVFLIQELDLEAMRQHQLGIETEYQNIFHIPEKTRSSVHALLETAGAGLQVVAVSWLENLVPSPQEVIYTSIPRFCLEEEISQLTMYVRVYTQAFVEAIQRTSPSRFVKKQGICLLVPLLGVVKGKAPKAIRMMKILSKIAFLQAMEFLATEAILPVDVRNLPITAVLIDHQSIAPLRAIETPQVCSSRELRICFTELMTTSFS